MPVTRRGARLAPFTFATLAFGLFVSSCTLEGPEPTRPTSCPADYAEPNDTLQAAREVPPLADEKSSEAYLAELTAHTTRDEDWFKIPVKDTGWRGNPTITVSVPAAFQVSTWFVCEGTSSDVACKTGRQLAEDLGEGVGYAYGCDGTDSPSYADDGTPVDPVNFAVLTTDCKGTTDDNGTLYVRVAFYGSAAEADPSNACSYSLSVRVE